MADRRLRIKVQEVFAVVELQERVIAEKREREARDPHAPQELVLRNESGPDRLNVYVSLSAETTDGQRIPSRGYDFGMGGGKHGIDGIWHRYHGPPLPENPQERNKYLEQNHHVGPADLEDGINHMLGRDPELHPPPRLPWTNLIKALGDHGITVAEEDLITAPLTIELHTEVQAELTNDR